MGSKFRTVAFYTLAGLAAYKIGDYALDQFGLKGKIPTTDHSNIAVGQAPTGQPTTAQEFVATKAKMAETAAAPRLTAEGEEAKAAAIQEMWEDRVIDIGIRNGSPDNRKEILRSMDFPDKSARAEAVRVFAKWGDKDDKTMSLDQIVEKYRDYASIAALLSDDQMVGKKGPSKNEKIIHGWAKQAQQILLERLLNPDGATEEIRELARRLKDVWASFGGPKVSAKVDPRAKHGTQPAQG